MKDILSIAKNKILVLDGAMGTMIQRYKLGEADFRKNWFENHDSPLKGNNDLLSLTRPDIIKDIHNPNWHYASFCALVIHSNYKKTVSLKNFYQEKEVSDDIFNCEFDGVLGTTATIVGDTQANEALKLIMEIGKNLKNQILIIDLLNLSFRKVKFK